MFSRSLLFKNTVVADSEEWVVSLAIPLPKRLRSGDLPPSLDLLDRSRPYSPLFF